jgi:hypothetical protein
VAHSGAAAVVVVATGEDTRVQESEDKAHISCEVWALSFLRGFELADEPLEMTRDGFSSGAREGCRKPWACDGPVNTALGHDPHIRVHGVGAVSSAGCARRGKVGAIPWRCVLLPELFVLSRRSFLKRGQTRDCVVPAWGRLIHSSTANDCYYSFLLCFSLGFRHTSSQQRRASRPYKILPRMELDAVTGRHTHKP